MPQSEQERFLARVVKVPGGCWLWTGCRRAGYGQFTTAGCQMPAHRFSYLLHVGEIGEGLHLHHTCENPACVNPEHLQPVTPREHALELSPRNILGQKARQTHCHRGHEFIDANTYRRGNGRRQCRACMRFQQAARRAAADVARLPRAA